MADGTGVVRLSWTMAKRYGRCPYLAYAHRTKQVDRATDEKPFFVGRVVHSAAEVFLHRRGIGCSLTDFIPAAWTAEEANVAAAGTVIWTAEERAEAWARALTVGADLDAMLRASGLLDVGQLWLEPKFFQWLPERGSGMYANPDILAIDGTTGWLGEVKTGTSYEAEQPDWYVATIERDPAFAHIERWIALPIRPAVTTTITPVEVVTTKRQAQRDRASAIAAAMHREEWTPKPGSYCNWCEARRICPSYQATYGHLDRTGAVGLGNI